MWDDYWTEQFEEELIRVYEMRRDQAMHGFTAVDQQGQRIDPAGISVAPPRNHEKEDR